MRALDHLARYLPAHAVAAIEAFDPERRGGLGRRPVRDHRRADPRAGRWCPVGRRPSSPSRTRCSPTGSGTPPASPARRTRSCPSTRDALAAATRELAGPLGAVWSGDASEGFNGGGDYVRWVRDERDQAEAVAWFLPRCDRVRVMPFLDGVPCSIHGLVLPDGTVAFRPVEISILRDEAARTFQLRRAVDLLGRATADDRAAMRGRGRAGRRAPPRGLRLSRRLRHRRRADRRRLPAHRAQLPRLGGLDPRDPARPAALRAAPGRPRARRGPRRPRRRRRGAAAPDRRRRAAAGPVALAKDVVVGDVTEALTWDGERFESPRPRDRKHLVDGRRRRRPLRQMALTPRRGCSRKVQPCAALSPRSPAGRRSTWRCYDLLRREYGVRWRPERGARPALTALARARHQVAEADGAPRSVDRWLGCAHGAGGGRGRRVRGDGRGGPAGQARPRGHAAGSADRGSAARCVPVEPDGFSWDGGPTYTMLPAVVRDLFRKSGRPVERELDLVELDVLREHRFEDGSSVRLPGGSRAAQIAAVDELGAGLGPTLGRPRPRLRRRLGGAAPRVPRAAVGPRPPARAAGRPAEEPRDAGPPGPPPQGRRLRLMALLPRRGRGPRAARRAGLGRGDGVRRAAVRRLDGHRWHGERSPTR